jgi:hypothetical protein
MDKTRASLRRVRVYLALLLICGVYAVLPHDHGAKARARDAAGSAMDWAAAHIWRIEK